MLPCTPQQLFVLLQKVGGGKMLPDWDGTNAYELSAEVNKCASKEAEVNISLHLSKERP